MNALYTLPAIVAAVLFTLAAGAYAVRLTVAGGREYRRATALAAHPAGGRPVAWEADGLVHSIGNCPTLVESWDDPTVHTAVPSGKAQCARCA